MSKIGRRPIPCGEVKVEVKGNEVHYSGKNTSGVHQLPDGLLAEVKDGLLTLSVKKNGSREVSQNWGLHRALLNNKIFGAQKLFEKQIKITGLGYKASLKGNKVEFSLGFSHKVNFDLPKEVSMEVDKTGQLVTLKSFDKELVGKVSGEMRLLRPTEPYKGTGVKVAGDVVRKKAGKAKSAA